MIFLKNKINGINKNNIIFIDNFLNPVTKKEILKKNYQCKYFKVNDTKQKLSNNLKICNKTSNKLLKKIKSEIEKTFSFEIDDKFHNLIFSAWLSSYTSINLYNYKLLLAIKKKYPNFALINLYDKEITEEDKFLFFPNATILQLKILKNIGEIINVDILDIKSSDFKYINKFVYSKEIDNKFKFFNLIKFLFSQLSIFVSKLFYNKNIYLHDDVFKFSNILRLILKSKFKFSYLFFLKNKINGNKFQNKKIYMKRTKTKIFEKIILKNLYEYVPNDYYHLIKHYKYRKKKIKNSKDKNDVIISKKFSERRDLRFVKFLINNLFKSKFMAYQHGGAYGQEKSYFPEKVERSISDYFISWGWQGKKVMALPSPNDKILNKYNNIENYCLFVSQSPSYDILSYFKNLEFIKDYSMKESYNLILNVIKKTPIILRLPPLQNTWRDNEYFQQINNLKIDEHKKNFYYMAKKAKYLIINHFNTTALEALSMNKPTLIFSNKKLIEFNKKAKKDLIKLEKAKIFFYDYKNLIKFLKKNNYDLSGWWNEKRVQKVRESFCKKYILTSENWEKNWILKFTKSKHY